MKKFILLSLIYFSLTGIVDAQRLEESVNYPITPQVAAIFKAIAAPVSYYTGQPDVSIPVYTITQDGVQIPINISFNTSGIFVNEEAGNIGIGVKLNWGGSIIRTPNGQVDERGFFTESYRIPFLKEELQKDYTNTSIPSFFPYNGFPASFSTIKARENEYANINSYNDPYANGNGNVIVSDLRPDDFYYNVLGKSGLFKFNQVDRTFITFPLDDIKINKTLANKYLQSFEIIRSDGVRAIMGDGAEELSTKENKNIYTNYNQGVVQSWFVKKIITSKNTLIDFSYISNQYKQTTESRTITFNPAKPYSSYEETHITGDTYTTTEKLIETISFKDGRLDFIYVNDRVDFPSTIVSSNELKLAPRLSQIILSDSKNNKIKKIQFHQSYFKGESTYANLNSRLRLDSLSINDNQSKNIERYKFEYNDSNIIPAKNTIATNKDLWGYYNNSSSNRYINSDVNKLFTIKKIIFPTGGERVYTFENNMVSWNSMYSGKLKEISNDGFDSYENNYFVGGSSLDISSGNPIVGGSAPYTNTIRTVYGDEFTIQGAANVYSENIVFSAETSYVNPSITLSQVNGWPYKIEVGLQKKEGMTFIDYTSTSIDRNHTNLLSTNKISYNLTSMANSTYRFYVKMTCPPTNIMANWPFRPGHITTLKLKYLKKNFNDIKVGGLRIREIVDIEKSNQYKTTYEYIGTNNICSGQLITAPEYKEYVTQRIIKPGSYNTQENPDYINYYGTRISSEPIFPLLKTQGSNVGYTNVIKRQINRTEEIKEEFVFSFVPSQRTGYLKEYYQELEPKIWQSGKLLSNKKYKNNMIISEEIFDYYGLSNETNKGYVEELNTSLVDAEGDSYDIQIDRRFENPLMIGNPPYRLDDVKNLYAADNLNFHYFDRFFEKLSPPTKIPYFKIYTGFDKLKSKTTIDYLEGKSVSQTENYYYNTTPTSLQLSSQTTTNSKGETLETKFYYAQDQTMVNEPFRNELLSKNIVSTPLKTEVFKGSNKLSEKRIEYGSFTSAVLADPLILPKYIYTKKGSVLPDQLEKKVSYQYDNFGNITQYTIENDNPVSILWGYNKTQPIAKIENASIAQVSAALGISDLNNVNETNLGAINNLRTSLPNAMVTTYAYKPLVGVSTITDPKGHTTTYTYDSFGRLEFVKDNRGNILSENQYNYKP